VILGHLWVHVADTQPKFVFSGDGVALFLIVSGYGLMSSYQNRPMVGVFLLKRLRRVMVPYWIITIFLIVLDYFFLKRTYSLQDIAMTVLGLNINQATHHIDYVRWYITFLLFWYISFLFAISVFKDMGRLLFLMVCAVTFFLFDYYISHLGFYQFAAFPIGCIISVYWYRINSALSRKPRYFLAGGFIALFVVIIYKSMSSIMLQPYVPGVVFDALCEVNSILFSLAWIIFVAVLGFQGYCNTFLCFCGKISYELFLLHGAFLIKYNPIIVRNDSLLPVFFTIFFFFALTLSWGTNKIFSYAKLAP
jgi:peptidoglycan/LPS O-acetylase OafA/YrhL